MNNFEEIIGKTFWKVYEDKNKERIVFEDAEGKGFELIHVQDCCEDVYIEDICGDLADLENTPIIAAYESYEKDEDEESEEDVYSGGGSATWSFYHFRTIKGTVTIRFYGASNGYYSETAELYTL